MKRRINLLKLSKTPTSSSKSKCSCNVIFLTFKCWEKINILMTWISSYFLFNFFLIRIYSRIQNNKENSLWWRYIWAYFQFFKSLHYCQIYLSPSQSVFCYFKLWNPCIWNIFHNLYSWITNFKIFFHHHNNFENYTKINLLLKLSS